MLKKLFDDEPVLLRGAVLIVFMLASWLGLPVSEHAKDAINLVGLGAYLFITRMKVTPNHQVVLKTADLPQPQPSAAVIPAQPKEHEMDIQEFEDTAKARVAAVLAVADAAWAALPEGFRHDAIDALGKAVNGLADVAAAQVEKITPPSIDALIEEEKAKVKAAADARIAALDTLKPMVAA